MKDGERTETCSTREMDLKREGRGTKMDLLRTLEILSRTNRGEGSLLTTDVLSD